MYVLTIRRWVFSTALSSSERGDHAAFDSSKSDTWEEYEGASWDISYGDGSGASGTVGFDQVDVGGITATRQAVEIATAVSSAFVSDENNDGLLGLAFGVINTIQPKSQQTFFESVADQLEEKAFTADLDVDAAGTYEFGESTPKSTKASCTPPRSTTAVASGSSLQTSTASAAKTCQTPAPAPQSPIPAPRS